MDMDGVCATSDVASETHRLADLSVYPQVLMHFWCTCDFGRSERRDLRLRRREREGERERGRDGSGRERDRERGGESEREHARERARQNAEESARESERETHKHTMTLQPAGIIRYRAKFNP